MKKMLFVLSMLMFAIPCYSQVFTEIETEIPGFWGSSADWGDYDNDGDLDFLVKGSLTTSSEYVMVSTRIYRNDGNDVFTEANFDLMDASGGVSNWGDYDNDGDLDMIICGSIDGWRATAKLYRNDDTTFTEIDTSGIGNSSILEWADYDNDGDLDLLSEPNIYRNDGGDHFTSIEVGLLDVSDAIGRWGDYDNDGDMDILLAGYYYESGEGHHIGRIYRNEGSDSFTETDISLQGVSAGDLEWIDYDNDGDLDIFITGNRGDYFGLTRLYRNDGAEDFIPIYNAFSENIWHSSADWGDFDNDGDADLLLMGWDSGNHTSITKIYENDGDGDFLDIQADLSNLSSGTVNWGDYDNDGDLDILQTGLGGGLHTKIYRNDGDVFNIPPSPPQNLICVVDSGYITLSWDTGNDAETDSLGLYYNLQVGTEPGLRDIMSSQSDFSSGYRKIVDFGNVQKNTSWKIKNLSEGDTYYWSVQAIDPCWAGSQFSVVDSFIVPVGINDVEFSIAPQQVHLSQNHPNPFNPTTTIQFEIPQTFKTHEVYLGIYDISGKLIKTLVDKPMEPGYHSVVWNGKDDAGQDVASGVYFYRLQAGEYFETKFCLLIK